MIYESLANKFLASITAGDFDDAEQALGRLHAGFRSDRCELAYLPISYYYFMFWYRQLQPSDCTQHDVLSTLLRSAEMDGRPQEAVTWALRYFAEVLTFLGRYQEAIEFYDRVMRIEMRHWTLPIGPEAAWGAGLAECYRRIGEPEQAARVTDLYMAEHDRLGQDAIQTRMRPPVSEVTTQIRAQVAEKAFALGQ